MKKEKLSLDNGLCVISVFNQVHEFLPVLERVERYFPKNNIIIVDDGSTDGSAEMAKENGFKVISHPNNIGVGAAIRTGLKYAMLNNYKWVIHCSSNGKIKPEEFNIVYGPLLNGQADYVTGSRFVKGGSSPGLTPFRRVTIPVFSFISSLLLGQRFSDITCGFRAYTLEIFSDPKMNIDQDWLNKYEMEYYIHYWASKNSKIKIIEVPVTIPYTHLGKKRKSKIKPFSGWWSMIRPFVLLFLNIKK